MTVLTDAQRGELWTDVMRGTDCPGGLTKPQLRAVVDALDDWWDTTGAIAANAAIPQPQRGILTSKQKARLFVGLLEARYKVT